MTVVLTYEQIRLELAEAWFADWRLHPNDTGYEHYFNDLWAGMRPILEG